VRNVRRTFVGNGEGQGEYDRLRKARPDAEGERRNGAPGGATSSQEGVHIRISRAAWRAVPSLPDEERNETNLGRIGAARTKEAALNDE